MSPRSNFNRSLLRDLSMIAIGMLRAKIIGQKWGTTSGGSIRYGTVAYILGQYHWFSETYGSLKWECDDFLSGKESFGL